MVSEVLPEGPLRDEEESDEEHPPPCSVTVTVVAATVKVVVAHDVTVDAGHSESVGDKDPVLVAVPLVLPEVSEPEDGEGPGPPENVAELVIEEVPDCGTPHSSRL